MNSVFSNSLARIYFNTCGAFAIIRGHIRAKKKKKKKIKSFDTHTQIKQHSTFLFQLLYYKRVIFAVYLVPDFFFTFVLFVEGFTV